ncbi:hypothetical protein JTB14_032238 [Gonioctena quinquepunctata]|nr:hypothetical protein JTB14_032238 [Gonioctena quinquepunctata]
MSENDELKLGQCEVCQQSTERRCSGCKLVFYCNAEHQQANWKEHKNTCKSFEISSNPQLGRYLKATRDLQRGDFIFSETPLVFGPKPHHFEEGPFPCVGCCRLIYDHQKYDRCSGCSWPVCSQECDGLKITTLHGFECNVLKLRLPNEKESFYDYYR